LRQVHGRNKLWEPVRIGVYLSTRPPQPLERMIEQARALEQRGIEMLWIGQLYEYEALALAALLGRETQRIALGTWVVPTYPRHPSVLAQQALTAQAASRNRLVLGIGLSHRVVIEKRLGLDFSRPVRHMREYLEVLLPLLRGEPVAHEGQCFRVRLSMSVPDAKAPPVLVGALGPQMLRLCARLADGVAIWLGGADFLERFALAILREASAAAERPFPRLAVGLPIAVCRDRAAARSVAAHWLAQSSALPSYQAVLARGGAAAPEDIAILGDEAFVRDQLARLAALGVSDFNAVCMPFPEEPDSLGRTLALLAEGIG
jgi:5,10-methylenetetrahydromethanopterin reductase